MVGYCCFLFRALTRAPVEHLIGQFASGMTGLLRKLVEGWTSLSGSDSDAVARQFTSFVPERTHRPTGCRGRYDYNSSQELADTQDELDGDAALNKKMTMTWRTCSTTPMMINMLKFVQVVRRARLHQMSPHRRKSKNIQLREARGCRPQRGGGLQRMLGRALLARGLEPIQ